MQRCAGMRWLWSTIVVGISACAHAPSPAAVPVSCGQGWAPLTDGHAPGSAAPIARAPEDAVIDSVRIAGVSAEVATTLASALQTRPGMRFGDAPFKADLQRLWGLGVVSDAHLEATGGAVVFVLSPQPSIGAVELRGRDAEALRRFALLRGAPFEPHRLWRMATALEADYVRDGHLDARVAVEHALRGPGVDVCVAVEPGPRVTIGSVTFPGRRALPEAELRKVMHTDKVNKVGGLYDADALSVDLLYIMSAYWDRGYAMVKTLDPRIVRHGAKLAIELPIVEGERFRIGHITSPVPVVGLRAGELFSRSKIAGVRDQIEKQLGVAVLPLTKLDVDARRVDLTFEPQWRWPWDALLHSL